MYKPSISLVNGEIIKDLLDLCNEHFIESFIKPYAGANSECKFCGARELKSGKADHLVADCPVMKYHDIVNKHKRFIVKI